MEAPDRLSLLAGLMNGWLAYETEASDAELERVKAEDADKPAAQRRSPPGGFVEGSEAHGAAVAVGWPLVALGRGDEHLNVLPDLFDAPAPLSERYDLDEAWIEAGFPVAWGGDPPADNMTEADYVEDGIAIAWDEARVIVQCPRGVCVIPREAWAEGWRHCPGC